MAKTQRYAPVYQVPQLPANSVILLFGGGDSLTVGVGALLAGIPPTWLSPGLATAQYWTGSPNFSNMYIYQRNNYNLETAPYAFSFEQAAHYLSDYYSGATVYVHKYGQSGATLSPLGSNGAGLNAYNRTTLKDDFIAAKAYIEGTLGKTVLCPVFHCDIGTNDANYVNSSEADAFQTNLNIFYNELKNDLGLPDLKFGITRISINSGATYKTTLRTKTEAFVAEDAVNRYYLDSDSWPMNDDTIHRTTQGYILEANAYFAHNKNLFRSS